MIISKHTFGTNAHLVLSIVLEETLDSTAGELVRDALVCLKSFANDARHGAQMMQTNSTKDHTHGSLNTCRDCRKVK